MYRLTVVSGPNLGATFTLREGENSVGRQTTNAVVLASNQVSKRHCILVASNGELLLRDEGSANGTFVNGTLIKNRMLRSGDRISVGEYVLEINAPGSSRNSGPANHGGMQLQPLADFQSNVVSIDSARKPGTGIDLGLGAASMPGAVPGVGTAGAHNPNEIPKDLKGKLFWALENYLMPIFYGLNLKHEWKFICALVFAGFLVANLVISVQPLIDANTRIIIKESGRRAKYMAQEIAEKNAPYIAANVESKTEIGSIENAEGVRIALLMDLDQRVIAPASKLNQYMVQGDESRIANVAAAAFRGGRETGIVPISTGDTVVAVEPVKVFNAKVAKNVVVGMAVVAIDTSIATLGMGEVSSVYSETLILTGILGALMLFILYRLTLKPFQVLNEDMDKALKGDLPQVTHEFKMEELSPLWDLINSALQRIPRSGHDKADGADEDIRPDQFIGPAKMMADAMGLGLVVCGHDRRVAFVNPIFEELSGIRAEGAVGQELASVARDQSLGVLTQDLFDRCATGTEVSEEYDFAGVGCSVRASAFVAPGDVAPKAYVLIVVRKPE